MSVVELHPEELLDREADGEISEAELGRLERHVAQCAACRVERQVRADFRREEEPLDEELDVQRLLSEVLAPGAEREVLRVPVSGRARRLSASRRWRSLLLVAAALLVGGVAAAAGWTGLVGRPVSSLSAVVVEAPSVRTPTAVAARGGRAAPAAPTSSSIEDEAMPEGALAAPASAPAALAPTASGPPSNAAATMLSSSRAASPSSVNAPPSMHSGSSAVAAAVKGGPTFAGAGPTGDNVAAAPIAPADAASLFARANAARRSDDHVRAEDLYRALLTEYPESLEANQSRAVLGRMLLEDGGPSRALRYFDEYLTKGGPLAEDVMSDRAAALARLGRTREESEAWSQLLDRYPASVHADRARVRLRELGAP